MPDTHSLFRYFNVFGLVAKGQTKQVMPNLLVRELRLRKADSLAYGHTMRTD